MIKLNICYFFSDFGTLGIMFLQPRVPHEQMHSFLFFLVLWNQYLPVRENFSRSCQGNHCSFNFNINSLVHVMTRSSRRPWVFNFIPSSRIAWCHRFKTETWQTIWKKYSYRAHAQEIAQHIYLIWIWVIIPNRGSDNLPTHVPFRNTWFLDTQLWPYPFGSFVMFLATPGHQIQITNQIQKRQSLQLKGQSPHYARCAQVARDVLALRSATKGGKTHWHGRELHKKQARSTEHTEKPSTQRTQRKFNQNVSHHVPFHFLNIFVLQRSLPKSKKLHTERKRLCLIRWTVEVVVRYFFFEVTQVWNHFFWTEVITGIQCIRNIDVQVQYYIMPRFQSSVSQSYVLLPDKEKTKLLRTNSETFFQFEIRTAKPIKKILPNAASY